jgi:hypothetical protein
LQQSPLDQADSMTAERLRQLLDAESAEATNLAAAATARLNPSLLDPQLRTEVASTTAATETAPAATEAPDPVDSTTTATASQPWGEITYMSEKLVAASSPGPLVTAPLPLNKGGFRIDNALGAKARHSRARFDPSRRKQVQEVRKIGACIRCRILRKTCSQGSPCETCRKVLAPRIWKSGCVRTKFTEQLDIYFAGVQIVLSQQRITSLKASHELVSNGSVISCSLIPEHHVPADMKVYISAGSKEPLVPGHPVIPNNEVVMIDNDKEDVAAWMEAYMRAILPELVQREPSHFVQTTLNTAMHIARQTNDELLNKAIELWGFVEVLNLEQQWNILVKASAEDEEGRWIHTDGDYEIFATICLQLNAAAERKAGNTSKALLTGMQRVLQDSKTKVDFSMFFTTLLLLNCVEKSTWAFKAWEQESLRATWPLDKDPIGFTQQGHEITPLLRMLLDIRKALPRTAIREEDGVLFTEEHDEVVQSYFQTLNLTGKPTSSQSCHVVMWFVD